MKIKPMTRFVALACAIATTAPFAAQVDSPADPQGQTNPGAKSAQHAARRVTAAAGVVQRLDADPRIKEMLKQSKGILIVPSYGSAALGVGAHVGAGVLLLKMADGGWSGPAFYDLGGLTLGLQAGVEGGAIAMILNNDKAVRAFMKKNNFALNAEAGLTVLNWSKVAMGSLGTGDIVAWSGAKGLFGDAADVGVSDVRFNQGMTNAYYGRALSPGDIANGSVSNPQSQALQQALGRLSPPAS